MKVELRLLFLFLSVNLSGFAMILIKITFLLVTLIVYSTMYGGGPYAAGFGLPISLTQELKNSFFLAADVIINNLVSVPPPADEHVECSVAAHCISDASKYVIICYFSV